MIVYIYYCNYKLVKSLQIINKHSNTKTHAQTKIQSINKQEFQTQQNKTVENVQLTTHHASENRSYLHRNSFSAHYQQNILISARSQEQPLSVQQPQLHQKEISIQDISFVVFVLICLICLYGLANQQKHHAKFNKNNGCSQQRHYWRWVKNQKKKLEIRQIQLLTQLRNAIFCLRSTDQHKVHPMQCMNIWEESLINRIFIFYNLLYSFLIFFYQQQGNISSLSNFVIHYLFFQKTVIFIMKIHYISLSIQQQIIEYTIIYINSIKKYLKCYKKLTKNKNTIQTQNQFSLHLQYVINNSIKQQMKQTGGSKQNPNNNTQNSKSIPKSTVQKSVASIRKSQKPGAAKTISKYKLDAITKQNFDISGKKENITEIAQLHLKYVLKCIDGLYKNRFLFLTTHPDGEIFGSGDAKLYGLTLQIQGVGLAPKHAQLQYDGFKSFNVRDFNSQNGTWMNVPSDGVQIHGGDHFSVGPFLIAFQLGEKIDQIEEICACYHLNYLSDILRYNQIKTMAELYKAQYNNFQGYPFDKKEIEKLKRICHQSKNWFQQGKKYRRLNMYFLNEPLKDFSIEIGWQTFHIASDPELIFAGKNPVAQVVKGRLVPHEKVFTKIKPEKQFPLSLHSQIKIGDLAFQMTRFNSGSGVDIGFRSVQQDGLIIQQDIGGSQWKLISLFAVFDGHGGPECMKFMSQNLVAKIRQWTQLLDQAGDINQMIKLLMNKTFYQLDFQFHKKYQDLAQTCGATGLVVLIIQKRVYCFHIGDCKGYLFRNQALYQMNIDHLPSRGDERLRIEGAGGFIQYDRLMGKCTLSRCLGQFQYKSVEDYENQFKGKLKSYLSCIPQMVVFDLQVENDDFILLSTDGIFGGMNIHQITDFIMDRYEKLETEQNPNKIISSIIENCKIVNPQCDNMAVILIIIRKGEVK